MESCTYKKGSEIVQSPVVQIDILQRNLLNISNLPLLLTFINTYCGYFNISGEYFSESCLFDLKHQLSLSSVSHGETAAGYRLKTPISLSFSVKRGISYFPPAHKITGQPPLSIVNYQLSIKRRKEVPVLK
jgi:hypothetical protein